MMIAGNAYVIVRSHAGARLAFLLIQDDGDLVQQVADVARVGAEELFARHEFRREIVVEGDAKIVEAAQIKTPSYAPNIPAVVLLDDRLITIESDGRPVERTAP